MAVDDDNPKGGGEGLVLDKFRARTAESRHSVGKPTDAHFDRISTAVIGAIIRHFYPDTQTQFDGCVSVGDNKDVMIPFMHLGSERGEVMCEMFAEKIGRHARIDYDDHSVDVEVSEGDAREHVANAIDAIVKDHKLENVAAAAIRRVFAELGTDQRGM